MLTVFISGLLVKKKQHQKKQTGNLQKKTCLGELIVGIDVGYSLKWVISVSGLSRLERHLPTL